MRTSLGVLLLLFAAGSVALAAEAPAVKVEFRRAEVEPKDGYMKFEPKGAVRPVYVSNKTELSNADIAMAQASLDERGLYYCVDITMTDAGAKTLKQLSQEHLDKPLAILIDGKVLMAPTIRSPLSKRLQISGNLDKQEAERIAGGIVGKPDS